MAYDVDWVGILKKSSFADKADCIAQVFGTAKLNEHNIQNAPAKVGHTVCGESIYLIVEELLTLQKVPQGKVSSKGKGKKPETVPTPPKKVETTAEEKSDKEE